MANKIVSHFLYNGDMLFYDVDVYDVDEFYFENKCFAWADEVACSAFAISELVRNVEFEFRTYRHQLYAFCPAFDYIAEWEFDWFATFN